jgi:thiamine transporter ThiT
MISRIAAPLVAAVFAVVIAITIASVAYGFDFGSVIGLIWDAFTFIPNKIDDSITSSPQNTILFILGSALLIWVANGLRRR